MTHFHVKRFVIIDFCFSTSLIVSHIESSTVNILILDDRNGTLLWIVEFVFLFSTKLQREVYNFVSIAMFAIYSYFF